MKRPIWAALWTAETPPPDRCDGCLDGRHSAHQGFIWPEVNGVVYGPLTCDCLTCDPVFTP